MREKPTEYGLPLGNEVAYRLKLKVGCLQDV